MPQLNFPSPEAPPYCAFALDYPEAWVTEIAPGALAVVVESQREAFRSNVLIGAVRLPIETGLEDATEAAREAGAESTDTFTVVSEDKVTVNAVPATLQLARFVSDQTPEPLAQLQVLLFAPTPVATTHDLFRIHATCTAARIDECLPLFREMVESFRFAFDEL